MKRNILSTGEESNRFARKNYLIHLSRHCKFAFYSTTMPFPHTCIHTHTHTTLYVLESSIREIESREFAVSSLSLWFGVHLPPPLPHRQFSPFQPGSWRQFRWSGQKLRTMLSLIERGRWRRLVSHLHLGRAQAVGWLC